jgi:hypothetical protein
MLMDLPLRVSLKDSWFIVKYDGRIWIRVNIKETRSIVSNLGYKNGLKIVKEKIAKKKKPVRATIDSRGIFPSDPEFKHFILAIAIIKRHDVTYKKFIQAQIEGLSFADGGKGIFPKPSHLSTDGAESRLLEFLRDDEINGGRKIIEVNISPKERATPLSENSKYKKFKKAVKDETADLQETLYVRELQVSWNNKPQKFVEKHLNRLLSEQGLT